jgi:hypothetical protein
MCLCRYRRSGCCCRHLREHVGAVAAVEKVVSQSSEQLVVPVVTEDLVVATGAIEHVRPIAAVELIVTRSPGLGVGLVGAVEDDAKRLVIKRETEGEVTVVLNVEP